MSKGNKIECPKFDANYLSTADQLTKLIVIGNMVGLSDASDWLRRQLAFKEAHAKTWKKIS